MFVESKLVLQWVPGREKVVRGDTKMSMGSVSPGVLQRSDFIDQYSRKIHQKMTIKSHYFYQIRFLWQILHEILNQRFKIDPSTKFHLNPSKSRKNGQNFDFASKTKN